MNKLKQNKKIEIDFGKNTVIDNITPTYDNELINDTFTEKYIQKIRNLSGNSLLAWDYGCVKMFRIKPKYAPGWKKITDYGRSIGSQNGFSNNIVRCNVSHRKWYRNSSVSYTIDMFETKAFAKCSNYCVHIANTRHSSSGDKNAIMVDSISASNLETNVIFGESDINISSGYKIWMYEFVGGDYWYDDINNISYGKPHPNYCLETNTWK